MYRQRGKSKLDKSHGIYSIKKSTALICQKLKGLFLFILFLIFELQLKMQMG